MTYRLSGGADTRVLAERQLSEKTWRGVISDQSQNQLSVTAVENLMSKYTIDLSRYMRSTSRNAMTTGRKFHLSGISLTIPPLSGGKQIALITRQVGEYHELSHRDLTERYFDQHQPAAFACAAFGGVIELVVKLIWTLWKILRLGRRSNAHIVHI